MVLDELLRAARDRQPGAWPRLIGPLRIRLQNYLTPWVNAEDAKDVAQRSLIIVWEKLPGFDLQKESLEAWVLGIARHQAINELRAQSRRRRIEDAVREVQLSPPTSSSSGVRWLQRREMTQEEIAGLPGQNRRVIEHDLADGDPEVLAHKEGIALATVRSRRHRAHELLRERVRQRCQTPVPTPTPTPTPTPPAI